MILESNFKYKKVLKIITNKDVYFIECDENLNKKEIIKRFINYCENNYYNFIEKDYKIKRVQVNFNKKDLCWIDRQLYPFIEL